MKYLDYYKNILDYENLPKEIKKYFEVYSLERLKFIGYFCGMDYASKKIYKFDEYVSRYDHSITTSLITYKYTKEIIPTLAALFHDISTPCFSHVIDYMNKDYEIQESTEEKTKEIILNDTSLIKLLNDDNINPKDIIDFKRYSIVDLDRPKMCADRLDGIILTALFWTKSMGLYDAKYIIDSTEKYINENNQEELGFIDEHVANYVLEQNNIIDSFCHSKYDTYMMELLAKITKLAIKKNIITYDDLYEINEISLLNKLINSKDIEISKYLYLFQNIDKNEIEDFELPKIKTRTINPLVNNNRLY